MPEESASENNLVQYQVDIKNSLKIFFSRDHENQWKKFFWPRWMASMAMVDKMAHKNGHVWRLWHKKKYCRKCVVYGGHLGVKHPSYPIYGRCSGFFGKNYQFCFFGFFGPNFELGWFWSFTEAKHASLCTYNVWYPLFPLLVIFLELEYQRVRTTNFLRIPITMGYFVTVMAIF